MRFAFAIAVLLTASPLLSAAAQDLPAREAPVQEAPPPVAPPAATDVAPPIAPPGPRTPEALVRKSIEDASRGRLGAALKDDVKALRRGPLLVHGNYCGIGNRPGTPPVDALDAACMRHDACTRTGKLPTCACDDRLRIEAAAIAADPQTPPDLQATAAATATAMTLLVCKITPRS